MSSLVIGEQSTARYSTLRKHKQDSIPVECVPPTCKLYVFWWPPQGVSTMQGGVGTQMNKFEQVSSDDHQMSMAGGKGIQASCLGGVVSRSHLCGEGKGEQNKISRELKNNIK